MEASPSRQATVRGVLDELAAMTWHRIAEGPACGFPFREESITDHNLFDLRARVPEIEAYKFSNREESSNGADFEWWIGSEGSGWIGVRFQAKKLDDRAYPRLGHRVENSGRRQYDLLLDQASHDGVWAFYCFYNGWNGSWPEEVPNATCPNGRTPAPCGTNPSGACAHASLEDFGCAVSPAAVVAWLHGDGQRRGGSQLEAHLGFSRPWSHFFGDRRYQAPESSAWDPRAISQRLREWVTSSAADAEIAFDPDRPRGAPASGGVHQSLPWWLQARRDGASQLGDDGRRPSVAVIFDLSDWV